MAFSSARSLDSVGRWSGSLFVLIGLLMIVYQSVTVLVSVHDSMQHYITHLAGLLVLAALMVLSDVKGPEQSNRWLLLQSWGRMLLAVAALVLSVLATIYLYRHIDALSFVQPFIPHQAIWFGALLIIATLCLTALLWGLPLALLCVAAVVYFAYAHLLPFDWAPSHTRTNLLISTLSGYGGTRGLFRFMPLSADMIFLLLVYGGLLRAFGVIAMFSEIGRAIGNLVRGGVAYSAVIASTMIGMVTGQAVSNIALSGGMTIPVMHRAGYSREQSGAIEVVASTGSQLLPPIMGLGAFLMAEILGVPYFDIVVAGLIPGVLFMLVVAIGLFAMTGATTTVTYHRAGVDWWKILWVAPSLLLSLGLIIAVLYLRYSPALAGLLGCSVLIVTALLRPSRYRPRRSELIPGLRDGLRIAVYLGLMLAAIGLVVQTLSTTGAGISLGRSIAEFGGGAVWLTLLTGMVVALLIGMGLPTPAAYALIAIVVVPALIDVGLAPLTAHMFGFYFAILSTLTPPVAVGVLTAIQISGGRFLATTGECFKLCAACFLIPYLFVANPALLNPTSMTLADVWALGFFCVATALSVAAVYGALLRPMSMAERWLAAVAGPLLFVVYLAVHMPFLQFFSILALALLLSRQYRPPSAVPENKEPV